MRGDERRSKQEKEGEKKLVRSRLEDCQSERCQQHRTRHLTQAEVKPQPCAARPVISGRGDPAFVPTALVDPLAPSGLHDVDESLGLGTLGAGAVPVVRIDNGDDPPVRSGVRVEVVLRERETDEGISWLRWFRSEKGTDGSEVLFKGARQTSGRSATRAQGGEGQPPRT